MAKKRSEQQEAALMAQFVGAARLEWKDEDQINGVAVGPLVIVHPDGRRVDLGWQKRTVAESIATTFELPLTIF